MSPMTKIHDYCSTVTTTAAEHWDTYPTARSASLRHQQRLSAERRNRGWWTEQQQTTDQLTSFSRGTASCDVAWSSNDSCNYSCTLRLARCSLHRNNKGKLTPQWASHFTTVHTVWYSWVVYERVADTTELFHWYCKTT